MRSIFPRLFLGQTAAAQGFELEHLETVGSTNAEAMSRRDSDRIWIVADEQTAGRGRRGRDWTSPVGNLYASLRLMAPSEPVAVAQLCFVAALAVSDAVIRLAPHSAAHLKLKWPNDVLIEGAKVSGILIEGSHGPDGFVVVIGCGVNVVSHPAGTPYPTTSLISRDPGITAAALFAALSDAFAIRLDQWARSAGFSGIRDDWITRAAGIGDAIVVRLPTCELAGRFETLDEDGNLILHGTDGRRAISAGEIFFPATSSISGGT